MGHLEVDPLNVLSAIGPPVECPSPIKDDVFERLEQLQRESEERKQQLRAALRALELAVAALATTGGR